MVDKGDFSVPEVTLTTAEQQHSGRSERAVDVDAQKRAPVTTDYQAWADDMDDLDFPGVDTPSEAPHVLPKDLKNPAPTNLAPDATEEMPADAMQVEAETVERIALSQQDVSLSPDEAFRGVGATSSREMGGFNATYGGEQSPVNETTPPDIKRGENPQMQSDDSSERTYEVDLPKWSASRLRTELNKQVYENDRDDLADLRERVSIEGTTEFTPYEYSEAKELIRERKEEAEERAERMDANIFGDTEEQAEIEQKAFRGFLNNPPK